MSNVWLEELFNQFEIRLEGLSFQAFDFMTSATPTMIAKELEEDWHQVKNRVFTGNVLDLGANTGMWTMFIALKNPLARVVAVEPMPHNVKNLTRGLQANRIENVTIVPKALWHTEGEIWLRQHPLNSGAASIHYSNELAPKFLVPTITPKQLMDEYGPFEFTKVDIEGAEHFIDLPFQNMSIELHHLDSWTEEQAKEKKQAFVDKYQCHIVDAADGKELRSGK